MVDLEAEEALAKYSALAPPGFCSPRRKESKWCLFAWHLCLWIGAALRIITG